MRPSMKKSVSFIIIMLSVCCIFTACSVSQSSEEFRIAICQNTDGAVYGIHCEYYLADTPIGGTEVVLTENKTVIPIESGDTISLHFDK
ncbi:MAG: hypothetical protein HFE63_10755, partial [Clostridiales bacterium]|nr:hypothetical protein [Clostridiales bacterium]